MLKIYSLPAYAGRVYDATFRRLPLALKATSYGHSFRVTLYYANVLFFMLNPTLQASVATGQRIPYHSIINKRHFVILKKNGNNIECRSHSKTFPCNKQSKMFLPIIVVVVIIVV